MFKRFYFSTEFKAKLEIGSNLAVEFNTLFINIAEVVCGTTLDPNICPLLTQDIFGSSKLSSSFICLLFPLFYLHIFTPKNYAILRNFLYFRLKVSSYKIGVIHLCCFDSLKLFYLFSSLR